MHISEVKNCLVMDPGSKHFACCIIKKGMPVWFGYHPAVQYFQINDIDFYKMFVNVSEQMIKWTNGLVIERYVCRMAVKGVSVEALNLMIGTLLSLSTLHHEETRALTSSAWKRKVAYDDCIDEAKEIGFLKKDKHFVDNILTYSIACGYDEDKAMDNVLKALPAYKTMKAKELWYKNKNK